MDESGIYLIENINNGMKYVGQTVNLQRREREHMESMRKGEHHNKFMQRDFNRGGNFRFRVLEQCNETQLNNREKYWINHYNSFNRGYNQTRGGAKTQYNSTSSLNRRKSPISSTTTQLHKEPLIIFDDMNIDENETIIREHINKLNNYGLTSKFELNTWRRRVEKFVQGNEFEKEEKKIIVCEKWKNGLESQFEDVLTDEEKRLLKDRGLESKIAAKKDKEETFAIIGIIGAMFVAGIGGLISIFFIHNLILTALFIFGGTFIMICLGVKYC